jgi:2-polyprenyl-6-hydroxyphenyl methylase / 3-demethylubiquinone-9 3-methyltransferase
MTAAKTVDAAEIEKFSRMSAEWWDPSGPFRPLHRLNPVRLSYLKDRAAEHFGRDAKSITPFEGLSALDIGCGGGLVAEPMARLGATVTAVDADEVAIEAARLHAGERGVDVDYRVGSSDDLAAKGRRFDLVLALEIIEHVADRDEFLTTVGSLVAPGGLLILSTLNRTLKSRILGIGVAEHVLRWVEPGTHDWSKFVKPSELARGLRATGFGVADLTGLVFDPLRGEFRLSADDVGVNYFMTAPRAV